MRFARPRRTLRGKQWPRPWLCKWPNMQPNVRAMRKQPVCERNVSKWSSLSRRCVRALVCKRYLRNRATLSARRLYCRPLHQRHVHFGTNVRPKFWRMCGKPVSNRWLPRRRSLRSADRHMQRRSMSHHHVSCRTIVCARRMPRHPGDAKRRWQRTPGIGCRWRANLQRVTSWRTNHGAVALAARVGGRFRATTKTAPARAKTAFFSTNGTVFGLWMYAPRLLRRLP